MWNRLVRRWNEQQLDDDVKECSMQMIFSKMKQLDVIAEHKN